MGRVGSVRGMGGSLTRMGGVLWGGMVSYGTGTWSFEDGGNLTRRVWSYEEGGKV